MPPLREVVRNQKLRKTMSWAQHCKGCGYKSMVTWRIHFFWSNMHFFRPNMHFLNTHFPDQTLPPPRKVTYECHRGVIQPSIYISWWLLCKTSFWRDGSISSTLASMLRVDKKTDILRKQVRQWETWLTNTILLHQTTFDFSLASIRAIHIDYRWLPSINVEPTITERMEAKVKN